MADEHPMLGELKTLSDGLVEAKNVVLHIQETRDQAIFHLAKAGVSRKHLASVAGLAEVSIYKILEKVRGRGHLSV
jgi:hypothetical protein